MQSTTRTLEITVLSCEDLRIDRKSVKKKTYAVVRTDHLNSRATNVDTVGGGSYPCWNQKLTLDIPLHVTFLTLEACCKTASGRDRIIATAIMPVTDFMGGYLPDDYLNMLSYRLRDGRGEGNGIINLSVRVKASQRLPDNNKKFPEKASSRAACATSSGGEKKFDVVTGIPVWRASAFR